MKTKQQITEELHSLVNRHTGKVWDDEMQKKIQEDIMHYFSDLGISAREIEISCDDDGYVSVWADDFFYLKDAN